MSDNVTIYTCPNGCHAGLTCPVKVTQTWSVDIHGEPVGPLDDGEPDCDCITEVPRCAKCGATAEEHVCRSFPVLSEADSRLGTVYVSVDGGQLAWYQRKFDPYIERVALNIDGLVDRIMLDGVRYFLNKNTFVAQGQVKGQLSLLDGFVFAANNSEEGKAMSSVLTCCACRQRVVMPAFSKGVCAICGVGIISANTPADAICQDCAKREHRCAHCGQFLKVGD